MNNSRNRTETMKKRTCFPLRARSALSPEITPDEEASIIWLFGFEFKGEGPPAITLGLGSMFSIGTEMEWSSVHDILGLI